MVPSRTGALYGEKVIPDEIVEGLKTGDPATDLPLRSAMEWLQAQAACEGGVRASWVEGPVPER